MRASMWWEVAASLVLLAVPISLFLSLSSHRRRNASRAALWLVVSLAAVVLYVLLVIKAARTQAPS